MWAIAEEKAMERMESMNHNIFTSNSTPVGYVSTLIAFTFFLAALGLSCGMRDLVP